MTGGRLAAEYTCRSCGKPFHPWPGTRRKYCSVACSAAASADRHRRAQDRARAEAAEAVAAAAAAMTDEEVEEYLAGLEADAADDERGEREPRWP